MGMLDAILGERGLCSKGSGRWTWDRRNEMKESVTQGPERWEIFGHDSSGRWKWTKEKELGYLRPKNRDTLEVPETWSK